MYKKKKILAVVIARGNSKGIKNKNLKILSKKPLVLWPILSAVKSRYIDNVILSTDSKKIISAVKKKIKNKKFEIPFVRPNNLAKSNSNSREVIIHAIKFLQNKKRFYDFVVMLEPTSPSTTNYDIDYALKKIINDKNSDSLVTVGKTESQHKIFQFNIKKNNQLLIKNSTKYKYFNRQKLEDSCYLDGSLYISKIKVFLKIKDFIGKKTLSLLMPKHKNYEIDNNLDFLIAKKIFKFRNLKELK